MLVVQIVGLGDCLSVERLPPILLVSADEEDGGATWVESE